MKAIAFINHLPSSSVSTPSAPEHRLMTENWAILWLNREHEEPSSQLPGDTQTGDPTIFWGRVNPCDNLSHLGRYYTSPSNMLVAHSSHVFIWFYFWLRRGSCLPLAPPGNLGPGYLPPSAHPGPPQVPSVPPPPRPTAGRRPTRWFSL